MKIFAPLAALALLTTTLDARPADLLLTRKTHEEGAPPGRGESTQTIWLGSDRMRVEAEGRVTIVRLDQKKIFLLDPAAKTAASIELPYDIMKYVPEDQAGLVTQLRAANAVKATLTPGDETKTIGSWNAQKSTLTISTARGIAEEVVLWTTRDLPVDTRGFVEMYGAFSGLMPGREAIAEELAKLPGIPVRIETTRSRGPVKVTTVDEVVSAEPKEAPSGTFDVPADYATKPFDPYVEFTRGRGAARGAGATREGGATPPAGDPAKKDPPKRNDPPKPGG